MNLVVDLRNHLQFLCVVIPFAIKQHTNCSEGMPHQSAVIQWLYTAKAILCVVLSLELKMWVDYPVVVAWIDGGSYWSPDGTVHWGEKFCTGYGLFRGWWYQLETVSSL